LIISYIGKLITSHKRRTRENRKVMEGYHLYYCAILMEIGWKVELRHTMDNEKEKAILVVDDDEDILFTIRSIFKRHPVPVYAVKSGQECLVILKNGFRGVVLMDIMMPGMDGWDTIKEIVDRGLADNIIISMFTAKDVPDTKMEFLKEYVIDYITKPFEPQDLINIVNEYLNLI
jgi:CheY-like chemotaxis protein